MRNSWVSACDKGSIEIFFKDMKVFFNKIDSQSFGIIVFHPVPVRIEAASATVCDKTSWNLQYSQVVAFPAPDLWISSVNDFLLHKHTSKNDS